MRPTPRFRVDHHRGYDLLETDGTFDFDGGTLVVWKDHTRTHLLAAYSPASRWVGTWDESEEDHG